MKQFTLLAIVLLAASMVSAGCRGNHPFHPGKDKSPTARITTPVNGATFIEGDTIRFEGSGTDFKGRILPDDSLVWVSDKDGWIGTGSAVWRTDLSVDVHDISFVVTDKHGYSTSCTTRIFVNQKPPPTTILLLGSSYFLYNNLSTLLTNLCQGGNKDVILEGHYIFAGFLDDHAFDAGTEAKINSRQWDFVILQGVGTVMAFPATHQIIFPPYEHHKLSEALTTLRHKIKANCSTTEMVYCMPWAFEDGTSWLDDYDDDYFEMQRMIYDNTLIFSDMIPFVTAPVGWAWNTVMKANTSPHYLFRRDWNHPSLRGSYLMACVIYSTLFQESSENIIYSAGIPADEAAYFQAVASETVLNDLELWNIIP